MYALGLGIAQDLVRTYMWSTLAVNEDTEFAEENHARLANLMSAKQVAEGERLAQAWQPRKLTDRE